MKRKKKREFISTSQFVPASPFSHYTDEKGRFCTHFESGAPGPDPATMPHDLYGLCTGHVAPWIPESEKVIDLMKAQEGFVAVHPSERGVVWLFDSLNHAKIARNNLAAEGVYIGRHIPHFVVGNDGVPDYKDEAGEE